MPTPTAAERLHAQQQKNRKAAGLPDPSEYKKKLDSMKSEEVEQLDEMPESNMKVRDVHSHLKKAGWELARSKGGHDVFKHPKAKHSIPVPRHSLKAPLVRGIMKASKVEEQLEKKGRFVSGPIKQPFKSNTIVTSVKEAKDAQEYDYEGDMAKSDLRSIMHHAKELHDMIEDNTNLAEWCQSKITLAEDYLSTVANYMRSEMSEEIMQEDKNDYQRKIEKNNKKFIAASKRQKNPLTNVHTAQTKQKPVKEDVEQLDEKKNLPGLWANIHAKRKRGEPPAKPGDKDYPKTLNIESAEEPTEGEMKGKQQGVSRKAQIVRDAAKGKKSDNPDKFQKDPELSSEIHKT